MLTETCRFHVMTEVRSWLYDGGVFVVFVCAGKDSVWLRIALACFRIVLGGISVQNGGRAQVAAQVAKEKMRKNTWEGGRGSKSIQYEGCSMYESNAPRKPSSSSRATGRHSNRWSSSLVGLLPWRTYLAILYVAIFMIFRAPPRFVMWAHKQKCGSFPT